MHMCYNKCIERKGELKMRLDNGIVAYELAHYKYMG